MQNNTKITNAIAKIVELEGEEIFKNPKKFIALLNDLIPECTNERKVFQRALTEDIFALFLPIYKAPDSGSTNELMRISKRMETELLLSEKHCISVVCCFAVALRWEIPSQFNSCFGTAPNPQKKRSRSKEKTDTGGSAKNQEIGVFNNTVAKALKKEAVACTAEANDKIKIKKQLEERLAKEVEHRIASNKASQKTKTLCIASFGTYGAMALSILLSIITHSTVLYTFIVITYLTSGVLFAIRYYDSKYEYSFLIGLSCGTLIGIIDAPMTYFSLKEDECKQKQTENQIKKDLNNTAERIEYLQDRIQLLNEYCEKINNCQTPSDAEKEEIYATTVLSIHNSEQAYLNAAKQFKKIKGYKDAGFQADECIRKADEIHRNNDILYNMNKELYEASKLKQSLKAQQQSLSLKEIKKYITVMFQRLKTEKKIFSLNKKIRSTSNGVKAYLSIHNVGDTVSMGRFPQRKLSSALFKSTFSPVKWRVLDKQKNKMLLISDRSLLRGDFSQNQETWASSSIKALLNGHFLDTAFTEEEYCCIVPVKNKASDEMNKNIHSEDSIDKCFCLSVSEIQKYLPQKADLYAPPSTWLKPQKEDSIMERWWTRTTGDQANNAIAIICTEPNLHQDPLKCCDKNTASVCVRPAMWVDIEL